MTQIAAMMHPPTASRIGMSLKIAGSGIAVFGPRLRQSPKWKKRFMCRHVVISHAVRRSQ